MSLSGSIYTRGVGKLWTRAFFYFSKLTCFKHIALGAKASLSGRNSALSGLHLDLHVISWATQRPSRDLTLDLTLRFIKVFGRVDDAHTSVPSLICTVLKFSAGRETLRVSVLAEESLVSLGLSSSGPSQWVHVSYWGPDFLRWGFFFF